MGFGQGWKIIAKGTLFEPVETLGGHQVEQVPQWKKNSSKYGRQHWRNPNRASTKMTKNGRIGTKKRARPKCLILSYTTPFLPMPSALRTLRRPSRTTQWHSGRRWLISTKQNTWNNPKNYRFLKKDIPKWSLTSFLFRNTLSSY